MQAGLILMLGMILFGYSARLLQLIGIVLSIIGALMIILLGDPPALVGLTLNRGNSVSAQRPSYGHSIRSSFANAPRSIP